MDGAGSRAARRFWLLGLAQAAHSIEEMRTGLYDFFPVATARLNELIPAFPVVPAVSPRTFAANNMVIIAVLLGTVPFVQARRTWAIAFAWIAACVEILNGVGHLAGAVLFRGYVPGAATAPLLILAGTFLLFALRQANPSRGLARDLPAEPFVTPEEPPG